MNGLPAKSAYLETILFLVQNGAVHMVKDVSLIYRIHETIHTVYPDTSNVGIT